MRLNEFGKKARHLRMDLDLSLKEMADGMKISSAHLSALEYGDKKLNEAHLDAAIAFFRGRKVSSEDLSTLRTAPGRWSRLTPRMTRPTSARRSTRSPGNCARAVSLTRRSMTS